MPGFRSRKPESHFALAGAVFLAVLIGVGCGDVYRPVAVPVTPIPPNPAFAHVAVVVSGNTANGVVYRGMATTIDVSGDTDEGQTVLGLAPVHVAIVPNGTRFYAANKLDDTVMSASPAGSSSITTSLQPGSAPVFLNTTQNGIMFVAESGTG